LGLYRVWKANSIKSIYKIEELDGTKINSTYTSERLKKFVTRESYLYSTKNNINKEGSSTTEIQDTNIRIIKEEDKVITR
jgi:hypothetical protein